MLRFSWLSVLTALLLSALAPRAFAHDGGATAFARITISGQSVRYSVSIPEAPSRFSATKPRDARAGDDPRDALAQAIRAQVHLTGDATACAPGAARAAPTPAESNSTTIHIDFACPAGMRTLKIRDDSFDVLGADWHILARIEHDAGSEQFAFATENRETRITLNAAPTPARGVGSFFPLGVEHILTGYDHLLFLLALLIRGGEVWSLVKVITAFTLAHSVTLTAAALGWVVLPGRLVESMIALSIACVALENIFLRERSASKRWLVALGFGLVHGFGFSSVLQELGLPTDGLVASLLLFNLGVETGQAIVIAVAIPVLFGLQRVAWREPAIRVGSWGVFAIGALLFVERAFFA